MAEANPPDPPAGQEPPAGQGQEPSADPASKPPEGDEGRVYDKAYVQQLRRENAAQRDRANEAEGKLKEREDAEKTELERQTARADAAEARAAEAELRLLRLEVAAEHGLDASAVPFLTGNNREELELRAEDLAKLLGDRAKPTGTGFDPGARTTPPERGTPEQEHNALLLGALGLRRAT